MGPWPTINGFGLIALGVPLSYLTVLRLTPLGFPASTVRFWYLHRDCRLLGYESAHSRVLTDSFLD